MGTRGRKFQLQGGKTITAYLTHAVIALLYDLFYGLPCSNFRYRSVKAIEKHYYMTFIVPEILFQECLYVIGKRKLATADSHGKNK